MGLQAMRDAGAQMTTVQSLLFELLRTYEHPDMKSFMPLLKDNPDRECPLDLVSTPKL